jgi:hypothetical protein
LRFCGPELEQEEQEELHEEQEVEMENDDGMDISPGDTGINSSTGNDAYSLKFVGKLVAALTLTAEGSEEWILARVCGCREAGELLEVEDAEIEGEPEEKE